RRQDVVPVGELNPKRAVGKHVGHHTVQLDRFFFCHENPEKKKVGRGALAKSHLDGLLGRSAPGGPRSRTLTGRTAEVKKPDYQMCGTRSGARTIGSPGWHPKAFANSGSLASGPFARQ